MQVMWAGQHSASSNSVMLLQLHAAVLCDELRRLRQQMQLHHLRQPLPSYQQRRLHICECAPPSGLCVFELQGAMGTSHAAARLLSCCNSTLQCDDPGCTTYGKDSNCTACGNGYRVTSSGTCTRVSVACVGPGRKAVLQLARHQACAQHPTGAATSFRSLARPAPCPQCSKTNCLTYRAGSCDCQLCSSGSSLDSYGFCIEDPQPLSIGVIVGAAVGGVAAVAGACTCCHLALPPCVSVRG